MLILLPFVLVVVILALINHIYYSDAKPINMQKPQHAEKKVNSQDTTKKYLDKYIKNR